MVTLQELSLSDLMSLYEFVRADSDRTFGVNQKGKNVVRAKLQEVEKELYLRIYGCNPFAVTVEGQTPESIDLSKFDNKETASTYVVHTGTAPTSVKE